MKRSPDNNSQQTQQDKAQLTVEALCEEQIPKTNIQALYQEKSSPPRCEAYKEPNSFWQSLISEDK